MQDKVDPLVIDWVVDPDDYYRSEYTLEDVCPWTDGDVPQPIGLLVPKIAPRRSNGSSKVAKKQVPVPALSTKTLSKPWKTNSTTSTHP